MREEAAAATAARQPSPPPLQYPGLPASLPGGGIPPPPPQSQAERAARERERELAKQQARAAADSARLEEENKALEKQLRRLKQQAAAEQAFAQKMLEQQQQQDAERRRLLEEQLAAKTEPRYPEYWGEVPDGEAPDTVQVSAAQQPDLWAEMQRRVGESLADFEVKAIEVVRNKLLWTKYEAFKTNHARSKQFQSVQCACYTCMDPHQHERWDEHKNEMRLFHYAKPDAVDKIVRGNTGFDPRLGGGEYGAGAYFAHHAVYSVAYGNHWLSRDFTRERGAAEEISLLVGRVCLGHCRDFGPRCRSPKGDKYADAEGVATGLRGDWGLGEGAAAVGRAGVEDIVAFQRGPPHPEAGDGHQYDSVTGTEAQLDWTQNPRLRDEGDRFGRQFVTFETSQAYPDCVLHLRRRSEATAAFRRAEEQEARGKRDESMRPGTKLWIDGHGYGEYERFEQRKGSFFGDSYNRHHILLHTAPLRKNPGSCPAVAAVAKSIILGNPAAKWHVTEAPRERPELVPERVRPTLLVKDYVVVPASSKSNRHVQWVLFVSSPMLPESADFCACIRKRWSSCEQFVEDVRKKVNVNLDGRQEFTGVVPRHRLNHNFDEGELRKRQGELHTFFQDFAAWVGELCLDHINLFDWGCAADPDNVVVRFFTSENDYSQNDTMKNVVLITDEIRRRKQVMAAFRTSTTEAGVTEEGVPPVSFAPSGQGLSAIVFEPEPELLNGSVSASSSDEGE